MNFKDELNNKVPNEFKKLLNRRNSAAILTEELNKRYSPERASVAEEKQRI